MQLLKVIIISIAIVTTALFYLAFLSSRPPLMTESETLSGDGSSINYCEIPRLDGTGKFAKDIPKGNTPGCSYDHFPQPVLRDCTEPLAADADDLRGLWIGQSGKIGHVERIEQCGSRVVITSSGIIHDSGPNSTGGLTTNDTEGSVLFIAAGKEFCARTSAGTNWNNGVLDFHVFGWGPVVVRRYRDDEQLIWEYADGSSTRMNRLCQLPDTEKEPAPRGSRFKFFTG